MLTGLPLALSPGPLVWVSADRPYPGYQRGTEVSTPTPLWTLQTAHPATLRIRSRPLRACGSGGFTEVGPQLLLQELEEEEGGKRTGKWSEQSTSGQTPLWSLPHPNLTLTGKSGSPAGRALSNLPGTHSRGRVAEAWATLQRTPDPRLEDKVGFDGRKRLLVYSADWCPLTSKATVKKKIKKQKRHQYIHQQ